MTEQGPTSAAATRSLAGARICCPALTGVTPTTWSALPVEALERAPSRLAWTASICAFLTVALFTLQAHLQPEIAVVQRQPAVIAAEATLIAVSLLIVIAYRLGWMKPWFSVYAGLGFQLMVAFSIGLFETIAPWPPDQPVRGMSSLVAWILASSLFLPASPMQALAGAFGSAAMGPLAYAIVRNWIQDPGLSPSRIGVLYVPPFLVAGCAWWMSRLIFRMECSMHHARELGSYELEEVLGIGGMGEVWRARHRMLKREAAVKLIRAEALLAHTQRQADVLRRRFELEARAIASLTSPHTVSLYDFGVDQNGNFYYAMELLRGLDLEQLVKRFGPQPGARVVHILRQACESLEEAHCAGIVHRDIKPTNLFLCRLGLEFDFVKLLDFGLARWRLMSGGVRMTMENITTGTPAFMAPELALGASEVDGRTDLYGLGCVAYWLLTGALVFEEPTPTAMALAHVQKDPPPPSQRTEVRFSPELERIVLQCLSKKPEDRPASARLLRRMLEQCPECGVWSTEDAEAWWRTNLPELYAARCPEPGVAGLATLPARSP
ncbi:MAG: serine/threonine protein kinase [Bryobacteraceae bacterium]|nr:serine/threonine protein kinase [Bryobacteraceae bacterium]